MATFNGVNYALTQLVPKSQVDPNEWNGRVRSIFDVYEFTGEASGSIINVGSVPENAKVIDAKFFADALGSGVTVEMGDAGVSDRLTSAIVCTSAVIGAMAIAEIDTGFQYEYPAQTILTITTGVGNANGTVKTALWYVLN